MPSCRLALAAVTAVAAVITGVAPAMAAPAPAPAGPTSAAQARQQAAAADQALGRLNQRIAAETKRVHALSAAADQARARYSAQVIARQQAAAAADAAQVARQQAQADYDQAHTRFVQLIQASMEQQSNPIADVAYTVFTADSPTEVLDALQLGRLADRTQATVVGDMNAALDHRTAADHAQQAALARQEQLTEQLAADQTAAGHALSAARAALQGLQRDIAATKQSRLAAVVALSQFLGGWSMADPTNAASLNARYKQLAARAARLPRPANPGHWTPALGQYAASRALAWIGTPYAWAGGNAAGPTRGVCAGDGAEHDCEVVGFDCSGLALYGWAPFLGLPHLASSQYTAAGSLHPAVKDLLPGDLVFWSDGGTVGGIHHVAIYVGSGNVVQAPQSGDIVRVTPLASVDAGYFGATRPLT
jgi:cell wall-associated NlpC family hydrolase